jgi:IS5 family transposase
VIRDLERKLTVVPAAVAELLQRSKQIYRQQKQYSPKCYSIHAPQVECIAQGKAHKHGELVKTNPSSQSVNQNEEKR